MVLSLVVLLCFETKQSCLTSVASCYTQDWHRPRQAQFHMYSVTAFLHPHTTFLTRDLETATIS